MQMSREDFWDMTPRELMNAIEGYTDQAYEQDLSAWRRARWQAWITIRLQNKNTDNVKPGDLLTLDEEEVKEEETKNQTSQLSAAQMAEIEARWDRDMAEKTKKPNA